MCGRTLGTERKKATCSLERECATCVATAVVFPAAAPADRAANMVDEKKQIKKCHMPLCSHVFGGAEKIPQCRMFHAVSERAERWSALILDNLPAELSAYADDLRNRGSDRLTICKCHFNPSEICQVNDTVYLEYAVNPVCQASIFEAKYKEITQTVVDEIDEESEPAPAPAIVAQSDEALPNLPEISPKKKRKRRRKDGEEREERPEPKAKWRCHVPGCDCNTGICKYIGCRRTDTIVFTRWQNLIVKSFPAFEINPAVLKICKCHFEETDLILRNRVYKTAREDVDPNVESWVTKKQLKDLTEKYDRLKAENDTVQKNMTPNMYRVFCGLEVIQWQEEEYQVAHYFSTNMSRPVYEYMCQFLPLPSLTRLKHYQETRTEEQLSLPPNLTGRLKKERTKLDPEMRPKPKKRIRIYRPSSKKRKAKTSDLTENQQSESEAASTHYSAPDSGLEELVAALVR